MSYKIAEVKFNNGRGTVLCNVCRIMLTDACDTSSQIDCAHLCEGCYNDLNAENFSKLYDFVSYVANDYFELSHEKVRVQRDDYVKKAKKLLGELDGMVEQNGEGNKMKQCCEGGPMTAGCHHDRCIGPIETKLVEITKEEYALFQKLIKIWFHSSPDRSGSYFICGEAGKKDDHGLPDAILVCPEMGSNLTAVYERPNDKIFRSGQ